MHCTCIFRTCVFHPCEMRCFILAFSVLAFSSTCVFSAPRTLSCRWRCTISDCLIGAIVVAVAWGLTSCVCRAQIESGALVAVSVGRGSHVVISSTCRRGRPGRRRRHLRGGAQRKTNLPRTHVRNAQNIKFNNMPTVILTIIW